MAMTDKEEFGEGHPRVDLPEPMSEEAKKLPKEVTRTTSEQSEEPSELPPIRMPFATQTPSGINVNKPGELLSGMVEELLLVNAALTRENVQGKVIITKLMEELEELRSEA
jgi:hypothetical protein